MEFAAGTDHATLSGTVSPAAGDQWVLWAAESQALSLLVTAGEVLVKVAAPNGAALAPAATMAAETGSATWEAVLPVTGDYVIDVGALVPESWYAMVVTITDSAGTPTPTSPSPPPAATWDPPSAPVINPDIHVTPMVPIETTPCNDGVSAGYDVNGTTYMCAGQWWPDEFEGGIEFTADDRYPLLLGRSGPHVEFVQSMLAALGHDVGASGADGYFGVDTYHAVVAWQMATRRPVTAMVTAEDMEAMRVQLLGTALSSTTAPAATVDLANITVPSLCGYPGGQLVDGALPMELTAPGTVGYGDVYALGDLDGDGVPEIAASFYCNGGGVGWPEQVVVFREDLSVVGVLDLADVQLGSFITWRAGVLRITPESGSFRIDASFEQDAMTPSQEHSIWLAVVDGQLVMAMAGTAAVLVPTPGS